MGDSRLLGVYSGECWNDLKVWRVIGCLPVQIPIIKVLNAMTLIANWASGWCLFGWVPHQPAEPVSPESHRLIKSVGPFPWRLKASPLATRHTDPSVSRAHVCCVHLMAQQSHEGSERSKRSYLCPSTSTLRSLMSTLKASSSPHVTLRVCSLVLLLQTESDSQESSATKR